MLKILNTWSHGFIVVPVLLAMRDRGVFDLIRAKEQSFQDLLENTKSNPGYLMAAIRILLSMGWLKENSTGAYQLTGHHDEQQIPPALIELMKNDAISAQATDTDVDLFGKMLEKLEDNWGIDDAFLRSMLDGVLLIPVMLRLGKHQAEFGKIFKAGLFHEKIQKPLIRTFLNQGWLRKEDDQFVFTDFGLKLVERSMNFGTVVSYAPLLFKMDQLLFGDCEQVFMHTGEGHESHVDRSLNVISSGFQHQRYFEEFDEIIINLFNQPVIEDQPNYIADMGCGDGTLLRRVYRTIVEKTKRGQILDQHPVVLIGIDFNEMALIETTKTLKEIPHKTLKGDIGNPEQVSESLSKLIKDPENILHIRSFLDHDRPFIPAKNKLHQVNSESFSINAKGGLIKKEETFSSLIEHFERWAYMNTRFGMIILEVHSLPFQTVNKYISECENLHFDAYHALSRQHLVEASVFLLAAANAGFFAEEKYFKKFPDQLPYSRITFSYFKKQIYKIRTPSQQDINDLFQLEKDCWAGNLRKSQKVIRKRILDHPHNHLVIEIEGKIVGAVYSQFIESVDQLLNTKFERIDELAKPVSGVVQLLGLNVHPSYQHLSLGDKMLSFLLTQLKLKGEVHEVVGTSRCRDFSSQSELNYDQYVFAQDSDGLPIDSILRFHVLHGATVRKVLPGYRVLDKENLGNGVLINYAISNDLTGHNGNSAVPEKLTKRSLKEIEKDIEQKIKKILGSAVKYDSDSPLMEMGLDSSDLMVLGVLISNTYQIDVPSYFFFQFNTAGTIAKELFNSCKQNEDVPEQDKDVFPIADTAATDHVMERAIAVEGQYTDDIAIVDYSFRLPGANTKEELWEMLMGEKSAIGETPGDRWTWPEWIKVNTTHKGINQGGYIDDVDKFDASFFRISPREAELMDPQQRLLLELTWELLEESGYKASSQKGSKTGVFIGASGSDYELLLAEQNGREVLTGTGTSTAILANRISYYFDFEGPSMLIDTACSSSLVVINEAIKSIQSGNCTQALVGGINLMCHSSRSLSYYQSHMLSSDGKCQTFDEKANGFVRGEGAVLMFLKPFDKAIADGDNIQGIIKGSAVNHGGQSGGLTVPNPEKQQKLLEEVYKRAKIDINSISYIEAHGTGTSLGDPIEIAGLIAAFKNLQEKHIHHTSWCGVGSIKTNVGHLEAASGMAGMLKVLLSMKHKQLPSSRNFERLNAKINLEGSPFYILNKSIKWQTASSTEPLRAGISSFGIGGTNAHVVLEEYRSSNRVSYHSQTAAVILLSAKNKDRLNAQVLNLKNHLDFDLNISLHEIAYTLQVGREPMEERLAFVVSDTAALLEQLEAYLEGKTAELFSGNIKKDKSDFLLSGGAGQAYINYAIVHQEISSLAQLWVKGVSIDWNLLYAETKPNKISLPTYPFARERYWIPEGVSSVAIGNNQLHPLLHINSSSLKAQKYTSVYTGAESFLTDHKVWGEKILPGVAYLELAREAGAHSMETKVTQLKEVAWLQPIRINGAPEKVHISLYPSGDDVAYDVYTEQAGQEQVHSQGILSVKTQQPVANQDLALIRSRLTQSKDGAACYALFKSRGLEFGRSFQGIEQIYYSETEALSRISLPGQEGFILTPGLLDSAIQTCIAVNFDQERTGLELPFSVKEVSIYQELPESLWAYARKSSNNKATSQIMNYDIDLLNDAGEVLLSFRDFVTLPLEGISTKVEEGETEEAKVHLYETSWQESVAVPISRPDSSLLILLTEGSVSLADQLKVALEAEVEAISSVSEEAYFAGVLEKVKEQLQDKGSRQLILVCQHADYVDYGFISGLLKTAHQENPKFSGKIIGVESLAIQHADELIGILETERGTVDSEVRYKDGKREIRKYEVVAAASGSQASGQIKEGGVYLITGGAGGLGLIFAHHISKTRNTKLILTGRGELNEARKAALLQLPNAGYHRCDVSNNEEVVALINTISSKYGKLDGIIHSAGVIRDSFIVKKTREELSQVLSTKISGVKNLDEATRGQALDFMVYCSSIAGVMGNPGQADYASANAYLDNYAHYRNQEQVKGQRQGKTLSINWPLWQDGGMQVDQESIAYLGKEWGMSPMPTESGCNAFDRLLSSNLNQGIVAFGKESKIRIIEKHVVKPISIQNNSPALVEADMAGIPEKATKKIIEVAARLLKLDIHHIEPDEKLGDYGFDSILLTRLANELNAYYDLDLVPTVFFNYPTVESLVAFLVEDHAASLLRQHGVQDQFPLFSQAEPIAAKINDREIPAQRSRFFTAENRPVVPSSAPARHSGIADDRSAAVAIVGISGRFPGSADLASFWENIEANKDLITEIPADRWDWKKYYGDPQQDKTRTKAKWGGFIADIDKFDPLFFNISPREAELMDPQQRITLQAVYQALEDAGISTDKIKGSNTGAFIGVSSNDYSVLLNKHTDLSSQAQFSTGSAYSILVNRISYLLDIHGPSEPIDTACSSSLIAIHRAVENIRNGHCEMAIAGGVNALLSPELTLSFSQAGMLSEDGRCKSFDQQANGYVRGEGVGILILKSLGKAEADGDHIYGLIRGTAENHGGKANTLTSPNPNAQKELLIKAYKTANVDPRDVSYIEAHGTGTPLGDPIEVEGLKSAFTELYKERNLSQPEASYCAIGSVKANIGHLEAAAGMAGVIKVLLAMKHQTLPGNPQLETPNEYLKLTGSPFYLQTETKAWLTENNKPRIAGVSSFGFGGANAHVIIEEYRYVSKESYISTTASIIVLSARTEDRLRAQVANLKTYLELNPGTSLQDIAYTLQVGRASMEERMAIVCGDIQELVVQLSAYLTGNDDAYAGFSGNIRRDKLDFLLEGKAGRAYMQTAIDNRESKSLAQLWVKGVSLDWNLLYPENKPNKISLPTYPFQMKRYWFHTEEPIFAAALRPISIAQSGNILPPTVAIPELKEQQFESKLAEPIAKQPSAFTKAQIESDLSTAVCSLLYLEKGELDINKVFSELGLDSILGVELIKTINKRFNTELKASKLYDYPSVGQLSAYLYQSFSGLSGQQRKVGRNDIQPAKILSPAQTNSDQLSLVSLEDYEPVSKITEHKIQPIDLLEIDHIAEATSVAKMEKSNIGSGAYLRRHLQGNKQINNTVLN